jgi:hypothetical protein
MVTLVDFPRYAETYIATGKNVIVHLRTGNETGERSMYEYNYKHITVIDNWRGITIEMHRASQIPYDSEYKCLYKKHMPWPVKVSHKPSNMLQKMYQCMYTCARSAFL